MGITVSRISRLFSSTDESGMCPSSSSLPQHGTLQYIITAPCCSPRSITACKINDPMDHPALPRQVDRSIAKAKGSTVALEASPEQLQASKTCVTPSLKEIIEIKTKENGRLRAELAYLQSLETLGDEFYGEIHDAAGRIQHAIATFNRRRRELDKRKLEVGT